MITLVAADPAPSVQGIKQTMMQILHVVKMGSLVSLGV